MKLERSPGGPPEIWTVKSSASESDHHSLFLCLPKNEYYGIRLIKRRCPKYKDNKDSDCTRKNNIYM